MSSIPEYNDTTWALPVGCYSILVWHDAIIRSFPGGTRKFERVHQPKRKSWLLYLVIALTEERLAEILSQLEQAGLVPGVDIAVSDRVRRPLLECPGIAFSDKGRMRWWIAVTARPGELEELEDAVTTAIAEHDGLIVDGNDIDIEVTDHGSIVLFRPVSPAGIAWIAENVAEDALEFGGALAVERRFAGDLVDGMIGGGVALG